MAKVKSRPLLRCSGWGDDCLDCPHAIYLPDGCNWDCPACMWARHCPCVDIEQIRAYWAKRGETGIDDHLLVDIRSVLGNHSLPQPEHLEPLAAAIRVVGVLFPLLVRVSPNRNGWERYQVLDAVSQKALLAARQARVRLVPVVVKEHLGPDDVAALREAVALLVGKGA